MTAVAGLTGLEFIKPVFRILPTPHGRSDRKDRFTRA